MVAPWAERFIMDSRSYVEPANLEEALDIVKHVFSVGVFKTQFIKNKDVYEANLEQALKTPLYLHHLVPLKYLPISFLYDWYSSMETARRNAFIINISNEQNTELKASVFLTPSENKEWKNFFSRLASGQNLTATLINESLSKMTQELSDVVW